MRLTSRLGTLTLSVAVVAVACTSPGSSPTTDTQPASFTTLREVPTTSAPDTTSTTQAPGTTTEPPAGTTSTAPQLLEYAVVAEERARRLAIIDPASPCLDDGGTCDLAPILTIELPESPHNLTGIGSVVYATHPSAGSVSRVDIATGEILTVSVGIEPHDIEPSTTPGALFVADEAGRTLLTVDAETLKVIGAVDLPAEPHDLAITKDAVWVTLIGRSELARVSGNQIDLLTTGGSPHDLIVDQDGLIWFSNWDSDILNTFDPTAGRTAEAPAGVIEPHHFAIAPDGTVWVSDNGGSTIVGFAARPVTVEVGSVPHHIAFIGDTIVVAVSGTGQAILVQSENIVARSQLTTGLHGVAVVELAVK